MKKLLKHFGITKKQLKVNEAILHKVRFFLYNEGFTETDAGVFELGIAMVSFQVIDIVYSDHENHKVLDITNYNSMSKELDNLIN